MDGILEGEGMERKEKKTEKFTVMIIPDAHADVKSLIVLGGYYM